MQICLKYKEYEYLTLLSSSKKYTFAHLLLKYYEDFL